MIRLYGIKNCDTVKKAQTWLNQRQIGFDFHDYKAKGITPEILGRWSKQLGWEALVNKRGTAWKKLPNPTQTAVVDEASAIALLVKHTSIIKRPLIEHQERVIALGFSVADYERIFSAQKA